MEEFVFQNWGLIEGTALLIHPFSPVAPKQLKKFQTPWPIIVTGSFDMGPGVSSVFVVSCFPHNSAAPEVRSGGAFTEDLRPNCQQKIDPYEPFHRVIKP
jgi:hypothetical protein